MLGDFGNALERGLARLGGKRTGVGRHNDLEGHQTGCSLDGQGLSKRRVRRQEGFQKD